MLTKLKPISGISFGYSDGKNEARQPNFESLFYDGSGYYRTLRNDPLKYLVVGRKGTGKTILVRYFMKKMQEEKNTFSKFIVAGDFTSEKLKNFDYVSIREEEREIFWRYLILSELTSMVVENEKGILSRKWVSKLKELDKNLAYKLEEMVRENTANTQVKGSLSEHGASISAGVDGGEKSTAKLVPASYFSQTDELMKTLLQVMKRVRSRYFFFFDDLDEIKLSSLQKVDGENNVTVLAKLLNDFVSALSYVNDKLLDINSKSRVISTLRKDVADQMQFYGSNINKVITDNGINITWFSPMIKDTPQNTPLGKLVLHKIRVSIDSYHDVDDKELFDMVFHKGTKANANPFRFIVNRGFGRPRDVIQYLNSIKEKFPNSISITYRMAEQVQSEYCSWFYSELQNEISILERHKSISSTIDAIKKNGKVTFNYETLSASIDDNSDEVLNRDGLKKDLKSLFTLGAIGNHQKKKGLKKPIIEYSYRDGTDNPDFSKNFIVHPALKIYLSL